MGFCRGTFYERCSEAIVEIEQADERK